MTVAKSIELKDKIRNAGAQLLKSAATKAAEVAGDGTTTATVLARALAREGNKLVAAGYNPMDLKRGMDLAVNAVVEEIKKSSKKSIAKRKSHRLVLSLQTVIRKSVRKLLRQWRKSVKKA